MTCTQIAWFGDRGECLVKDFVGREAGLSDKTANMFASPMADVKRGDQVSS